MNALTPIHYGGDMDDEARAQQMEREVAELNANAEWRCSAVSVPFACSWDDGGRLTQWDGGPKLNVRLHRISATEAARRLREAADAIAPPGAAVS